MYIKDIFRFVNFLKSQNQGRGINAKEFEDLFNQASMSLWRREIKRYDKLKESSAYLKNFEVESAPLAFDEAIPESFGYYGSIEILKYLRDEQDAITEEIDFIRTPDWLDDYYFSVRNNDTLYPPTEDYPIIRLVGSNVKVSPTSFDTYIITGIEKPVKVVYAVTTSTNGRDYIFDETNSIDTDWPEIAHGELIAIICKGLGISLKEDWLVQYENIQKQGEVVNDKSEYNK